MRAWPAKRETREITNFPIYYYLPTCATDPGRAPAAGLWWGLVSSANDNGHGSQEQSIITFVSYIFNKCKEVHALPSYQTEETRNFSTDRT